MSHCLQPGDSGTEYGLVLPFVVCETAGGPYADGPFVAGWQAAKVDSFLAEGPRYLRLALYTGLARQLELIAMQRGYTMRSSMWQADPAWTMYLFLQVQEEIDEGQMTLLLATGEVPWPAAPEPPR